MPGKLAISTNTPYASDIATPCAEGKPTNIQMPAAAPSRTPHPAIERGTSIESSNTGASAKISSAANSTPIARAAQTITKP
ncbi:hypothetical protein HVE01_09280 [Vreelandella venusta]|nr:hypothetical protein HVE01_09280 [Halomonas venusta]